MYQMVNLSFSDTVETYMKLSKEELAQMLARRDMIEPKSNIYSHSLQDDDPSLISSNVELDNDSSLESSCIELGGDYDSSSESDNADEAILKRAIKEYELASKEGDKRVMRVLKNIFTCKLEVESITSQIKTFEDAYEKLGSNHPYVRTYFNNSEDFLKPFLKLCIITAALNDGWKPSDDNLGNYYFPKFYIYPKGDDEGYAIPASNAQILYSTTGRTTIGFDVNFSIQLVYKSKALAEYSGRQFIDLWAEYLNEYV